LANHASAIKRHKQSEKRRERNTSVKSTVRTAVKKVKDAVAAGKADEAKTSLSNAVSELGKAASKIQSGLLQDYLSLAVGVGVVIIYYPTSGVKI